MVPELPPRARAARVALGPAGPRQAPPALAAARPPHEEAAGRACSTSRNFSRTTACARCPRCTSASPTCSRSNGSDLTVRYVPAESDSGLFGGNSNWRGPIWFPVNFLIIESLQKFHHYYGDDFRVECPTGSGQLRTIDQVADELATRLERLFLKDERGVRPVLGQYPQHAGRSALPRLRAVLRVLPRRYRPRRGRRSSDRLDWLGREALEAAISATRRPPPCATRLDVVCYRAMRSPAILMSALSMLPLAAAAESMRCGKWVVNETMTTAEILQKCGEPQRKEVTKRRRVREKPAGVRDQARRDR